MRDRQSRLLLLCALMAALPVLASASGCLAMRRSSLNVRGGGVIKGKLEPMQEGATTREDIVRAFGAPRQTFKYEDGREVLVYVYEREKDVDFRIFLLLVWKSEAKHTIRYNFELTDGLLVRHWREDVS